MTEKISLPQNNFDRKTLETFLTQKTLYIDIENSLGYNGNLISTYTAYLCDGSLISVKNNKNRDCFHTRKNKDSNIRVKLVSDYYKIVTSIYTEQKRNTKRKMEKDSFSLKSSKNKIRI